MTKISSTYQVGVVEDIEHLSRILEDMYRIMAYAINKKPDIYQRNTDGLVTDISLSDGDININTITNKIQMLTQHPTQTSVTWIDIS